MVLFQLFRTMDSCARRRVSFSRDHERPILRCFVLGRRRRGFENPARVGSPLFSAPHRNLHRMSPDAAALSSASTPATEPPVAAVGAPAVAAPAQADAPNEDDDEENDADDAGEAAGGGARLRSSLYGLPLTCVSTA